ncbi:MAG: hypothetical protein AVDCRST_MAG73-39, partial [uncultured Thermomicrobiales bacterium]
MTAPTARAAKPAARKAIVSCAVTGAIHVPSQTPYLPITADRSPNRQLAPPRPGRRSSTSTPAIPTTAARRRTLTG